MKRVREEGEEMVSLSWKSSFRSLKKDSSLGESSRWRRIVGVDEVPRSDVPVFRVLRRILRFLQVLPHFLFSLRP